MITEYTAAPLEILIFAVALAGVALRGWALHEAVLDMRAVMTRMARLVVIRDIVAETIGLMVKSLAATLALWAMTTPPTEAPRDSVFWTVTGSAIVVVLILMDAVSLISATIRRHIRMERECDDKGGSND